MDIFSFRQSKLGMTLVEMVISLVILGILMTSTMGMIISSNNIFISTSKSAIDKQVGNRVFGLMEDILRYTTHLNIYDSSEAASQRAKANQSFELDIKNTSSDSGWIKYKRANDANATYLYDQSFYGNRTIKYSVQETGNSHKHIELAVYVYRENKLVYTRKAVIKCINLGLLTSGDNSNAIVDKSSVGSTNQFITFSVDEQLIAGGKDAYSLEYKIAEFMAEYNAIQTAYVTDLNNAGALLAGNYDTSDSGITNTQNKNGFRINKSTFAARTAAYNKIVFGDGSSTTTYDSTDVSKCVNLRDYYQQKIRNLLHFTPTYAGFEEYYNADKSGTKSSTATNSTSTTTYTVDIGDPFYGVVATKEELYAGYLLKYYGEDTNKDGLNDTVGKEKFPKFTDAETFFAGTSIQNFIDNTSSSNKNFMTILTYFKDNVADDNDIDTNKEFKQQLVASSEATVYVTDGVKSSGLAQTDATTVTPVEDAATAPGVGYTKLSNGYITQTYTNFDEDVIAFSKRSKPTDVTYHRFNFYTFDTSASDKLVYNGKTYAYSVEEYRISLAVNDDTFDEYFYKDNYDGHGLTWGRTSGAKGDLISKLKTDSGVEVKDITKYATAKPATNTQDNPSSFTFTATQNIPEGVYYFDYKSRHTSPTDQSTVIFVLKGDDKLIEVSNSGSVTATGKTVDTSSKIAVPVGGTIIMNVSQYRAGGIAYQQAKYQDVDSGSTWEIKYDLHTYYAHQFTDYVIYGVDWNSWFVASPTGLINKLLTGVVNIFSTIFGQTVNKDVTGITVNTSTYKSENAIKSLGNIGQYSVNAFNTDVGSYNMATCVYCPTTGTWYYLPSSSTRISNATSKISFTSSKDQPSPIDVELGNGSTWANSTAMANDIVNRKLTQPGLFNLYDTSKDQIWVSLPTGNQTETDLIAKLDNVSIANASYSSHGETVSFSPDNYNYSGTVSSSSSTISCTIPTGSTITIVVNGSEIKNGATVTWNEGANNVKVNVTASYKDNTNKKHTGNATYTFNVTYTPSA